MSFQRRSVLFCYESLMMVEIYGKKNLRHINDGQRQSILFQTRFQRWSVLFCYESLIMIYIHEKNLQNLKDGRFVWLWDLNDGRFCFVTSIQWCSKFIEKMYEISMMAGFVRLCDLNDGRFCSFVPLRDFKDGRFCFVIRVSMMVGFVHYEICSVRTSQWR